MLRKILDFCEANNYELSRKKEHCNIIYIEGMNIDGTLNNDVSNRYNDLRMILFFISNESWQFRCWVATTEPGSYYTYNPINANGAARIKFGQYKAWQVGFHGSGNNRHEALVQVSPVTVHRDFNKDFKRTNDKLDTGLFGINQHWGYDLPEDNIGRASAGCLVGRTKAGHRQFMEFIKKDPRYIADREFIFSTIIIPGDRL